MLQDRTILMVVNEDCFFLSHRLAVGEAAVAMGWRVIVAAAPSGLENRIREAGIEFKPLSVSPAAGSLAELLRLARELRRIYRKYPEAIIHHVGMRQILVGNLALALGSGRHKVVDAVSGLGILFVDPGSRKAQSVLKALKMLYGAGNRERVVIFQNHDDERLFRGAGLLDEKRNVRSEFIKGSGVDLEKFAPKVGSLGVMGDLGVMGSLGEPERRKRVLFTGRLLRSKGVSDFIAAAEILQPEFEGRVEFRICGGLSGNADSMTQEEMDPYRVGAGVNPGYIHWMGHCEDIAKELRECDIVAFPSYYREGVPLSLIEACAAGKAIVTCDSVGCRDTVEEGVNGFLVEPQNPAMLASRIKMLLEYDSMRQRMGKASREKAEKEFGIEKVTASHIQIYSSLQQKGE